MRLNTLVVFPTDYLQGVPVRDRVLDGLHWDGALQDSFEILGPTPHLFPPAGLCMQPTNPGVSQEFTDRVSDNRIPPIVKNIKNVFTQVVFLAGGAFFLVARKSVMATASEKITLIAAMSECKNNFQIIHLSS